MLDVRACTRTHTMHFHARRGRAHRGAPCCAPRPYALRWQGTAPLPALCAAPLHRGGAPLRLMAQRGVYYACCEGRGVRCATHGLSTPPLAQGNWPLEQAPCPLPHHNTRAASRKQCNHPLPRRARPPPLSPGCPVAPPVHTPAQLRCARWHARYAIKRRWKWSWGGLRRPPPGPVSRSCGSFGIVLEAQHGRAAR